MGITVVVLPDAKGDFCPKHPQYIHNIVHEGAADKVLQEGALLYGAEVIFWAINPEDLGLEEIVQVETEIGDYI